MSLLNMKLQDIHKQLKEHQIKPSELAAASWQRVQQSDERIHAFMTMNEHALQQAASLDEQLTQEDERDVLFGVPVGIKDNIMTEGLLTTGANRILSSHQPVYDATVIQKLKAAGAIIIGKTNMDELGMGSSSEYTWQPPVRNPWQHDVVAGGSSGGSAAAVAAGQVCYALGSDTGGGVRQPAAYCGVVGLKPTYGLVSRYGLIAAASSLDHVGILTQHVSDAAHVLQAIAGHDPLDSTSAHMEVPNYIEALSGEVCGLRIGVVKEFMTDETDAEVRNAIEAAIEIFESLGAQMIEVSLPHAEYALSAYTIIAAAEASSNLARLDGVRYGVRASGADELLALYEQTRSEGFGDEAKRRMLLGAYVLSEGQHEDYYVKAQKVRTLIIQDFAQAFSQCDLLIGPTTPTTAFGLNTKVSDPVALSKSNAYTVPANLAGVPALSIPCGLSAGLPIGLQMFSKAHDELTLLRAAHAFELNTTHHTLRPEQ